jgi:8-oxo-dGTP pyrophosphatase MutT (NUDIX family)
MMNQAFRHFLLNNPRKLIGHIESRLDIQGIAADWIRADDDIKSSAVLFLLTRYRTDPRGAPEICLLLNKRSQQVVQPGDLCCPGGGIVLGDKILSGLIPLPISRLRQWPHWLRWRLKHPQAARSVMLVLMTGLREAWEEMHLNPLKVFFLGPLPTQQLILFRRRIFPLAAWVPFYPRLRPNREVARIVNVPLRRLLDPANYGRYRLAFKSGQVAIHGRNEFPCFIHRDMQGMEILWGATFRITMDFLKIAFDFNPPEMDALPVISGKRDEAYLNGSIWDS